MENGAVYWHYRDRPLTEEEKIDKIQSVSIRWLLDNNDQIMKSPNSDEYGVECQTLDDEDKFPMWGVWNRDLTTCLLLAVEKCNNYYKENEK